MAPADSASPPGVLAAAAAGVERFMTERGGDIDRIAGRAGLCTRQFALPTDRLSLDGYCRLFHEAARETGDGNLGLWFGQQFQPQMLGLIGFVALLSATVEEAVSNLATHFGYHQALTHTRLVRAGPLMRLEYAILDPAITERRHDAELTLGMFTNLLRHALGPDWTPQAVCFAHPQPEQANAHREAFQADVHFGQSVNALVFRAADLHRPMPDANPVMLDIMRASLIALARGHTPAVAQPPTLREQAHALILRDLPTGAGSIATLAAQLDMPAWTLQRRLAEQDLSYSSLLESVRYAEAQRLLRLPEHDISTITARLGYSETSAFSRAFRKWSGLSPRHWRQKAGLGDR